MNWENGLKPFCTLCVSCVNFWNGAANSFSSDTWPTYRITSGPWVLFISKHFQRCQRQAENVKAICVCEVHLWSWCELVCHRLCRDKKGGRQQQVASRTWDQIGHLVLSSTLHGSYNSFEKKNENKIPLYSESAPEYSATALLSSETAKGNQQHLQAKLSFMTA